jgi:hypothetical protein
LKKKKEFKKRFFKTVRWLHVYVSTALFTLLVFFSATGITLNNGWYHPGGNVEQSTELELNDKQLSLWRLGEAEPWEPDLNAVQEYVRAEFGLTQPSSFDLDSEMREVFIEYHVPAGGASVMLSADEKHLIIEFEKGSLLGILNDLHKGRHSGLAWKWLIDISAVFMLVFAASGLILLFQGKKYKKPGVIATLLGTVSPIVFYLLLVPTIG